jgi:hypothetical protein
MGDTTTLWVLEVLEIFLHTGNTTRVQEAWPAIVSAVNWSIRMSSAQGLPAHLVCTYGMYLLTFLLSFSLPLLPNIFVSNPSSPSNFEFLFLQIF